MGKFKVTSDFSNAAGNAATDFNKKLAIIEIENFYDRKKLKISGPMREN